VIASFAFCAVALSAIPRAAGDVLKALDARAGTERQIQRYRAQTLLPIRQAVDRYSTRDDRVLTNRRDPTTLHEAMRKGYAMAPDVIRKKKLEWFIKPKRKIKLYIHYGGKGDLPKELARKDPRWPLLVTGNGFRIYCLSGDCPPR
jgi:hypothetical protein